MRAFVLVLVVACGTVAESSSGPQEGRDALPTTDPAPADAVRGADGRVAEVDATTPDGSLVTARPYKVTKPSQYDATVPTPLVLLLHGYTGSGVIIDDYTKMSALAEKKTFLLAVPDGTKDAAGKRFWNASEACCNFDGKNVDDVAYLRAVIGDMKGRYNVDPKRVYVVGHSNGGFMAYRLACELSDDIAAVVSLAGASLSCTPANPVAALEVHGDDDGVIRYSGGKLAHASVAYPSAKATVAEWAANNGCDATLSSTAETHDLESNSPGAETVVARHACIRAAAELWTIKKGWHVPPLLPSAAEQFYAFLEAHPKAP